MKPVALVTGASAGIGAVFARRLAKTGYGLILVARRRDRLEALARELGDAEVIEADLTRDDDLRRVAERIAAEPNLELLVNNAGFGILGRFCEVPVEGQEQMHRLHVMATLRLTHAALGGMVARKKGAIINVSSVAAFGQSPSSVSYSATKSWMNSFTEGVDLELRGAGSPVKVQALCPGFTLSEFHDVAQVDRKTIPARLWMRAEDVVEASLAGLARGKVIVVPGRLYQVMAAVMRWTPKWAYRAGAQRYARATKRDAAPQKL
ncbi:MAG: SDR family oxidoreductase [Acidobacteriia bacterium]|nr:SDR family oxidoreductase [Terriglobia bacterium]